jgi:hypothetical protein
LRNCRAALCLPVRNRHNDNGKRNGVGPRGRLHCVGLRITEFNSWRLRSPAWHESRPRWRVSAEEERLYLGKLSRTYLLLFSLNAEPRIIEYFQTMASDFYLYVGSDILIHALSERYLRKRSRDRSA